jgi:hypothetical protein
MKDQELPSYGYQVTKRLTRQRKKPDDLKKWLTEVDFKKGDQEMEKWKQRDEKKEAGRRQKANNGPEMEGVGNLLCPFCINHPSVDHILWECKETEDQRTNMDMKWIFYLFIYLSVVNGLMSN